MKKSKYFQIDFLLALTFASMSIEEANEHTDELFEHYKSLKAKEHFQNGLTPDDRRLMNTIGDLAIAGARHVNATTGEFRWRTDLPTTKESFSREMDANEPVTEEMKAEVNGVDGSSATSTQTQAQTEEAKRNNAEAPGAADANTGEGKKQRKRLPDDVVEKIRAYLKLAPTDPGYKKQGEIAKEFGIDPSTVSDIKVGRGRYGKDQVQTADQATASGTNTSAAPAAEVTNGTPAPAQSNGTETKAQEGF